jgi:hypothetical protein
VSQPRLFCHCSEVLVEILGIIGFVEAVRKHKPGDRIYLFGFSRGAYTVRWTELSEGLSQRKVTRGGPNSDLNLEPRVKCTAQEAWTFFVRKYHRLFRRELKASAGGFVSQIAGGRVLREPFADVAF